MLLKKVPPKGRRLLILATSSSRQVGLARAGRTPAQVLEQMEMVPCFTDVLHVPNLSAAEHVAAVTRHAGVGHRLKLFGVGN